MKNIPDKASSGLSIVSRRIAAKLPPKGFFLLAVVIALLAALAATDLSPQHQRLYVEGEIAQEDVSADRTFLFEDKRATAARQELTRKMQPLLLILDLTPAEVLREKVQSLLLAANTAHTEPEREATRRLLSEETGLQASHGVLTILSSPVVQNAILDILPLVEQRLRAGVLPEPDPSRGFPGGMLIRNPASGEETLHPDSSSLTDIRGLEVQVSQKIAALSLTPQAKQAISLLFFSLFQPTLVPDLKATQARAQQAADAMDPVVYRVLRGEIIVQQGQRIDKDQQIKMQMLFQKNNDPFQKKAFLGISLIGLLMALGLLFSPSNKPVTPMVNKDFIFLSVLLALFALMSKGLAAHGAQLAEVTVKFFPESLAYGVPIAGAAALASQVFSARRYLVTGLLLSFFCTMMMEGGLPLFLFYFLAAMWSTWLTVRSSSRQDVVWSTLPLVAGLLAMWAGATMIQGGAHTRYLSEVIAVLGGGFFSMVLTFALAPVMEMTFGYTTRFRLMELLNLEQPLLRELMINAPGTYHHSLVVSNMCEAGAKRVGAHSLLCKVAALYHDAGKAAKANYFIENQPPGDNPHDRLSPSMSALILISHVKQGVEMAQKHRLGKEVTDIIRQHHGNSVIQYFYRKALGQAEGSPPPNIEDFRYPGPRPQSREAALVMLADIVEASSRVLDDPTPNRLRQHIDETIKSIYSAGQLDESELNFVDLNNLVDSFQYVLRGLYHHRISYSVPLKTGTDKPPTPVRSSAPSGMGAYGGVPGETPGTLTEQVTHKPARPPEDKTRRRLTIRAR